MDGAQFRELFVIFILLKSGAVLIDGQPLFAYVEKQREREWFRERHPEQ
jgi:hypothetical protein